AGLAALLLAALVQPVQAGTPAPGKDAAASMTRDVDALAAKIDRYFAGQWAAAKIDPARPAEDAEFLRRVYLDVVGRIPSVSEARAFLGDKHPDKRRRVVERLLSSGSYVNHWTNNWR